MTDRSGEILCATIREFIETGEPVSSGLLFEKYNFGIRPAMIRLELRDLIDQGYLEQPSHSAGRVPTDRGYQFFAERALHEETAKMGREFLSFLERGAFGDLVSALSESLGLLGVAAPIEKGNIYKQGLDDLVQHLDWNTRDELEAVISDFEALDKRLEESALMNGEDFIKVFIGRQSPVTRSECLSVFAGDYDLDGGRVLLMAIGPKRMDYETAANVFKNLKRAKQTNTSRKGNTPK